MTDTRDSTVSLMTLDSTSDADSTRNDDISSMSTTSSTSKITTKILSTWENGKLTTVSLSGVLESSSSQLERGDRKISAHATLQTPPTRTPFVPVATPPTIAEDSNAQSHHATLTKTPSKSPTKSMGEREKSDLDFKRRNKGEFLK